MALLAPERVAVDGGEIEAFVGGAGPVVVTTHPFQWVGESGGPLGQALQDLATIVVVNPRGCGGTMAAGDAADVTIAQLVGDLEAVRVHLGFDRWAVLGHSAGARIAIACALAVPEHLATLVLSCGMGGADVGPRSVYHPANAVHDQVVSAMARGDLATVYGLTAHRPELVLHARNDGGLSTERQRAFAVESRGRHPREQLAAIRTPTLVIGGVHDRSIPIEHQRELAALIPGAQLVELEAASHYPYLEDPDGFREAVSSFLARTVSSSNPSG